MAYESGFTQEHNPFVLAMPDEPELVELREWYGAESFIAGSRNNLEKVARICAWVHSRGRHDGWNEPSSPNALTLEEAGQGKSFRCV